MKKASTEESSTLDELDKQIVHGLLTDARIPFAKLAGILNVSEQTVARRYRSMVQRGIIHVTGQISTVPMGHARWILRISTTPPKVDALADSLAKLPDLSHVNTSARSEVICVVRPRSTRRRDALLRTIATAGHVVAFDAYEIIHRFELDEEWPRLGRYLTVEQSKALGERRRLDDTGPQAPVDLAPEDEKMLAVLAQDGRAPYARLAAETGWPAARVARRMNELVEQNVLYFDLDFAVEHLGYAVRCALWLKAHPSALDAAGRAMATHREVAFVAATTGTSNLFASIQCRDPGHLYRYIAEKLGPLDGVDGVEVVPALRVVKQAHAVMDANRIKVG